MGENKGRIGSGWLRRRGLGRGGTRAQPGPHFRAPVHSPASPSRSPQRPRRRPHGPQLRSPTFSAQRCNAACVRSFGGELPSAPRPAGSAPPRYLLRSREAALRQSSREQNIGYWRQISRPTSSRRRCFSFSPSVRTQGAISVGVAEAALQTEAEVEATPHQPSASPPPGRAADPDRRRPADGTPAVATQSPAHGLRRACVATPPSAWGSAVRCVRRHAAQGLSVPLLSSRPGDTLRPPVEGPVSQLPALFGNRGEAAAPSNRLYCGGKTEGCARTQEKLQPPAAVGPCLRDSLSSRAAGDCSLCDAPPSTLHASTP
ncbi:hypothetical protein BU61_6829 [Pontoporia blainvillei]|uniref:Uncharacterized protein n=1 Tax=Pontoporia blainvillei TaxID=48723 RepID=A0ABX0S300_PONBL|nr:hypothetical protein [Pontoporia blainvillei]